MVEWEAFVGEPLEDVARRDKMVIDRQPSDPMQQTSGVRHRRILAETRGQRLRGKRAGHRLAPLGHGIASVSGERLGDDGPRSHDGYQVVDFAEAHAVHGILDRLAGLAAAKPNAVADLDYPGRQCRIQPDQAGDVGDAGFRIGQQPLQPRQTRATGGSWRSSATNFSGVRFFEDAFWKGMETNLVEIKREASIIQARRPIPISYSFLHQGRKEREGACHRQFLLRGLGDLRVKYRGLSDWYYEGPAQFLASLSVWLIDAGWKPAPLPKSANGAPEKRRAKSSPGESAYLPLPAARVACTS